MTTSQRTDRVPSYVRAKLAPIMGAVVLLGGIYTSGKSSGEKGILEKLKELRNRPELLEQAKITPSSLDKIINWVSINPTVTEEILQNPQSRNRAR